jgi:hypothetical protein
MSDSAIIKTPYGAKGKTNYIPFIVAMIDKEGNLQALPYPAQDIGDVTDDLIYGVELMVNPASISNNMSKIVNRTQTMTAFIEEVWGEELDTVTFQGSTATFVIGGNSIYDIRLTGSENSPVKQMLETAASLPDAMQSYNSGVIDSDTGLTVSQRRISTSYQQFLRLVDIFRANGCIMDKDGFVTERNYIYISFGAQAYKGLFESLDITEDSNSPYRFVYTITFKSEETIFSYEDFNSVKFGGN